MANKTIKGLTVEIGGDTTKLGKALENVDQKSRDLSSELGQINRMLKLDPSNTELLAQKQSVLADAITNTSKKLDTLKEAERQVQAQFERGEVSEEQVRALKREIMQTESKLKSYERAVEETADAVHDLGQESKVSADDLNNFADKGLKVVGGLVTAAAGALTAAAEATREYRTDMGKLDVAFTDNGFSSEAATGAYRELVGVLGEMDQSVEAANHLAKLTDNEKDLAAWTGDILPGVFATFGDSLPIEGLTEAANETAKVGQVTGPLADAINWASAESGVWSEALKGNAKAQEAFQAATEEGESAEDAFNAALAECSTEQERQQLITQALTSLYGDASDAYKETNADVIAANQANDAWMASLAKVGAAVEPLITEVKTIGAELLEKVVPVVEWATNNLPTIAVGLGGITAALVSFKIAAIAATAAEKGMTLAQYAAATAQRVLNAAMSANPIGLVILAITALAAGFTYLWTHSEAFREFWLDLWEKIKSATAKAVDYLKKLPERISNAIDGAKERVKTWGNNLVTTVKTSATNMLNNAVNTLKNLPSRIWSAIVGAVDNVKTWGTNLANTARTSATNMLNNVANTLKTMPSRVWSAIVGAVDNVVKWGTNMASKAKTAMKNVVSTATGALKELPGKVLSIGGDLVTGLWNGVNDKLSWLKKKLKSFTNSVLGQIKDFFGVNSPSKETAWVGDMLDQGLAKGMLDNIKSPVNAMKRVTGGVLDAATTDINGLALERQLRQPAATVAAPAYDSGLGVKLDKILAAIERGQILTIDGDQLVGATVGKIDSRLGQRRALAARGAV